MGPSLSDPWRVREIQIAVAEWGLGSDVPQLLDEGGDGGGGGLVGGFGVGGVGVGGGGGDMGGVISPIDRSSGGLPLGGGGASGVDGVGGDDGRGGGQGRGKGALTEEGGWEWDGRVNSVMTGELVPPGGKTRANADLLLTIFSGSTGVSRRGKETGGGGGRERGYSCSVGGLPRHFAVGLPLFLCSHCIRVTAGKLY